MLILVFLSEFDLIIFKNASSNVRFVRDQLPLLGRCVLLGTYVITEDPPSEANDGNHLIVVCSHINMRLKTCFVLMYKVIDKIARSNLKNKNYRKRFVSQVAACVQIDTRSGGVILIGTPQVANALKMEQELMICLS